MKMGNAETKICLFYCKPVKNIHTHLQLALFRAILEIDFLHLAIL